MRAPHTDRIGRFELRREIGRGGNSRVFEAADPQYNRTVALKVLTNVGEDLSPRTVEREVRTMGMFDQNPHIVTVYEAGEHQGSAFIAMTYYPDGSVADLLAASGPQPVIEVLRCGADIAGALVDLHRLDVLHCDVKPHNVFVSGHGYVLGDFGISLPARGDSTGGSRAGERMTLGYAAPEVIDGRPASTASDVFSLGVTLLEMLTAHKLRPTTSYRTFAELAALVGRERPQGSGRRDSPPMLEQLIAAMLARHPADRPSTRSVVERLAEIGSALVAGPSSARNGGQADGDDESDETVIVRPRLPAPDVRDAARAATALHPQGGDAIPEHTRVARRAGSWRHRPAAAVAMLVALAVFVLTAFLVGSDGPDGDETAAHRNGLGAVVTADVGVLPPEAVPSVTLERLESTVKVSWQPSEGAERYQVTVVGAAGREGTPTAVSATEIELPVAAWDPGLRTICVNVRAANTTYTQLEPTRGCLEVAS